MIIDITGTVLIPGDQGRNCPGNGTVPKVECCCDECDYMRCCFVMASCSACADPDCPRQVKAPQGIDKLDCCIELLNSLRKKITPMRKHRCYFW